MTPTLVTLPRRRVTIRAFVRRVLALTLTALVAVPGTAFAATRYVNFCFRYNVSFTDDPTVAFDDGLANGFVPATGAMVTMAPPAYPPANPAFQSHLGSGDDDNCTGNLLLTVGQTYAATLA